MFDSGLLQVKLFSVFNTIKNWKIKVFCFMLCILNMEQFDWCNVIVYESEQFNVLLFSLIVLNKHWYCQPYIKTHLYLFLFAAGQLHATRAFTIMGMLAGLVAGALFVLRLFVMKEKPILSKLAAVVAAVAG